MKYFDPANQSQRMVNRLVLGANVITLSGTSTDGHTAAITINGVLNYTNLSYLTSSTITADAWCLANFNYYKAKGFLVTASAGVITVNPAHSWDTTNRINASIATLTGTLTGTYKGTFTLDGSKARIWEILLTTSDVIFATPVEMKDGVSVKLILVASTLSQVTTSTSFYINGTSAVTFDVDTQPYIIDGMWAAGVLSFSGNTLNRSTSAFMGQSMGSMGQSRTAEVFHTLITDTGDVLTDEAGNEILIPDKIYIY